MSCSARFVQDDIPGAAVSILRAWRGNGRQETRFELNEMAGREHVTHPVGNVGDDHAVGNVDFSAPLEPLPLVLQEVRLERAGGVCGVPMEVAVGGSVLVGVLLDGVPDAQRKRDVAVLARIAVFERAVPLGGLVDLFGDPVDVIGDDVADVDRGGFTVAQPAATDQTDEQGVTAVAIAPDLGERYLDTISTAMWWVGRSS
ncbi:hypothetical protein ACFQL8_38415 [Streptomyces goshikiensis]|uniref:hypothetical protein n=1 Tax=Streptomyces goshikiensis TaxID=1942 RepID=UPI00332B9F64